MDRAHAPNSTCWTSRASRSFSPLANLALVLLATTGPAFGAPDETERLRPLVAAVHVHSRFSTGTLTLDQLAERAERLGIDAIVLADNFALRFEYGLWPLRGVIRKPITIPSIRAQDLDRYLSEVAATQARHPQVLMVPGVEVVPHYYWTGSLLTGNLTMHNSQRNLLVLGLATAKDYASLPLSGNLSSYRLGWQTVLSLTPALLFIPAGWLWWQSLRRNRHARRRRGLRAKYARGSALVLSTGAGLLLLYAWPLSQPVFSSYDSRLGYKPYQALIDAVAERGGMVIWSLPEARDYNQHSFGPLGTVTVQTKPHPEALALTAGYTGFGGVYQDTRQAHKPGNVWDLTINQHLDGTRPSYPIAFGEIAFHLPGQAGIELDQVLNVLSVREWSGEGVIEAMRAGRLYALGQYRPGLGLRLDEFRVESVNGASAARSGEWLNLNGSQELAVEVAVSATDQRPHPVSIALIRSGQVVDQVDAETPLSHRFSGRVDHSGGSVFYRVVVDGSRAGAGEILSNPIFVGSTSD